MNDTDPVGVWGIIVLAAANYAQFEAAYEPVAREHDVSATALRDALADVVTAVEKGWDDPVEQVARETGIDPSVLFIGASKCRQHAVRKYPSKVSTEVYA